MTVNSPAMKKKGGKVAYLTPVEPTEPHKAPVAEAELPDHFILDETGALFAGRHLIIDLWDVPGGFLADMDLISRTLTEAAKIAGATLLNIDLHRFEPNGGISGVAVLAESHISIHTWPERGYAAIDAFMCGNAKPERSLEVLRRSFKPGRIDSKEFRRGIVVEGHE